MKKVNHKNIDDFLYEARLFWEISAFKKNQKRVTLYGIAQHLNRLGYQTARGGQWTNVSVSRLMHTPLFTWAYNSPDTEVKIAKLERKIEQLQGETKWLIKKCVLLSSIIESEDKQ